MQKLRHSSPFMICNEELMKAIFLEMENPDKLGK